MCVIEKRIFLSKCIIDVLNDSKKKNPEKIVRIFSGFSEKINFIV